MQNESININGTFIYKQPIPSAVAPSLPPSVQRIIVLDCSGSMSGDLPRLGKHLKNNLSLTLRDGDTVTLIWFSGRGQFGVIVEGLAINGLADLSALHAAIDRYLRPVGLTGFKEPLQETLAVIDRLMARDSKSAFSLTFMSDGYDNQWSEKEILEVTGKLSSRLAAAAVVEYGWYANRALLMRMSESLGAQYVFSENYSHFEPALDLEIRREVAGARKREVNLASNSKHGFAFGISNGDVVVYADENGVVRVPEDVGVVYYLSDTSTGTVVSADKNLDVLYAALVVLSQRMLADDVFRVLRVLGDVRLIREFANCFGKQAYSAFQNMALECVNDASCRLLDGYNPKLIPDENAYTVLDLLSDLMLEEGNMLQIGHSAFDYQRIGRKTVDANSLLTDQERVEIADMTARATSAYDLQAVQDRMKQIVDAKPREARFNTDAYEKGVPLNGLVLNENRPNISVRTLQKGTVEIGINQFGLPDEFPSFRWKNYTIIRDGILNVKTLPVTVTRNTWEHLKEHELVDQDWSEQTVFEIKLDRLPIVNRRMVKGISAKECFEMQFELHRAKAAQKVFKYWQEINLLKETSAGLKSTWGEEASNWLKEIGITDGGFAPKAKQVEATDVYVGREINVNIKGLVSSLPKVSDVEEKMKLGKPLNIAMQIMAPFIKEYQNFIDSDIYKQAVKPESLLQTWLGDKTEYWIKRAREINRKLSEIKFSIVVGQIWFPEFSSIDNSTMTLETDGIEYTTTASLKEVEVAV